MNWKQGIQSFSLGFSLTNCNENIEQDWGEEKSLNLKIKFLIAIKETKHHWTVLPFHFTMFNRETKKSSILTFISPFFPSFPFIIFFQFSKFFFFSLPFLALQLIYHELISFIPCLYAQVFTVWNEISE